ncbi:MAG: molybdopterin molybdenumtransferase MoeA [Acidimicrobiales bacterium]|nr:molybdopterin molybdotransferase MoeA [Hyphomonadaceae bacterium]RZV41441.1 MAG: molybdopterin molybdenumtransferase MoeA [Acidimicrobiales bacterium]
MVLIPVDQAVKKIVSTAEKMPVTPMPLRNAVGYVLASDIHSRTTLPPLDASAMDGYAIAHSDDLKKGSKFKVIGESPAGNPFTGTVGANECIRIFTGGVVPRGADHVIIQENVSRDGDTIILTVDISPSTHIRKAGIDLKKGALIASAGTRIDAFLSALIAAGNHDEVNVFRKPKVAILANGDELVEPGIEPGVGGIISSNPYGLGPLIEDWGGEVMYAGISKDSPAAIKAHIRACSEADILLPIGGASVGDRDFMRQVFDELGYQAIFTKTAVKPGKPTWFGTLEMQYVLGLPGNPASALVCAHIFLKTLMYAMSGRIDKAHNTIAAKVSEDLPAVRDRAEYIRARATVDAAGQICVTPFPRQDSSLVTPFVTTNCLLIRNANSAALSGGDLVQIMLIKALV